MTFLQKLDLGEKHIIAKIKDVVTQPEMEERFHKLERGVELQGLNLPQSQINKRSVCFI